MAKVNQLPMETGVLEVQRVEDGVLFSFRRNKLLSDKRPRIVHLSRKEMFYYDFVGMSERGEIAFSMEVVGTARMLLRDICAVRLGPDPLEAAWPDCGGDE